MIKADPKIPGDLAETLVDPRAYANGRIHESYAWLRANMPLAVAQPEGFDPFWVVTRHADVYAGFDLKLPLSNDRFPADFFDSIPRAEHATRIPLLRTTKDWIVGVDPPRHTHIRSLARKAFSKKIIDDIKPYAVGVIARVLTEAGAREEVMTYMGQNLHHLRRVDGALRIASKRACLDLETLKPQGTVSIIL